MSTIGLDAWFSGALESVRSDARVVALHLMHDHPVIDAEKRKRGIANVRKRSKLHMFPRLWHHKKVYAHYLNLYHPLWLGADGTIYREYVDLMGNSYFMEAEIWLRDAEGLRRIMLALRKLDPCVITITS